MKMFLAEFLAAICAALVLNYYFNDKPDEPPPQKVVVQVEQKISVPEKISVPVEQQPATQTEPQNYFANGQFKVGVDLPAGEYLAVGTGYVEVTKSSGGDMNNILVNDNIVDAQRYVAVADGEYVKVMNDLKLYPAAVAPKLDTSGKLQAGQYKVGTDIRAGEYKITLEAGGYFALTKDTRHAYVKNQFTNESGQFYVTVADGQYLQIKNGTGEFVGAAR